MTYTYKGYPIAHSDICVGDIVEISHLGYSFTTYGKAFEFFFNDRAYNGQQIFDDTEKRWRKEMESYGNSPS